MITQPCQLNLHVAFLNCVWHIDYDMTVTVGGGDHKTMLHELHHNKQVYRYCTDATICHHSLRCWWSLRYWVVLSQSTRQVQRRTACVKRHVVPVLWHATRRQVSPSARWRQEQVPRPQPSPAMPPLPSVVQPAQQLFCYQLRDGVTSSRLLRSNRLPVIYGTCLQICRP